MSVWVILGDGTRGAGGEAWSLQSGVGQVIFDLCLVLLCLAGVLLRMLAYLRGESDRKSWRTWSAVLPVKVPKADWTAPVAESMTLWREEVGLSDMVMVVDCFVVVVVK